MKNYCMIHLSESVGSPGKQNKEPQVESNQNNKISQPKPFLTRGSSEKYLSVNRLKKTSGKANTRKECKKTLILDLSPDRGWCSRLSLRKKSISLDTPEMSPEPDKEPRKFEDH